MKRINVIISVVLAAFGGCYAFFITRLSTRNLPNTLGIAFMPWLLVILLWFLSLLLLLTAVVKGSRESCDYRLGAREGLGIVVMVVLVFAYVQLMRWFGFLLITPVILAVLMLLSGSRKWTEILLVSVLCAVGVYFFFQVVFRVQLPGGRLF